MKFSNVLIGLVFLAPFTLPAQSGTAKLVEKVVKKPGELVIPYEKWTLPNGLTILVSEDHSDPIVHVEVTYHVGSNREQPGRSGFAHFFEHMMFQGSDNVADDEHFKIVTQSGGSLNGNTTPDRTTYFETMPNNQLETALWLEADRMGFFLDAVTQQKFEIQRSTVKNERAQNYDNRPYGLVGEKTGEALYPPGHSYSWPTIGYIEDLNRVDVNDLKKFFLRWYGPNNAVLTIAGDVTSKQVIPMVEKYFGPIPRGPECKPMAKAPVTLTQDKYISYEDNVRFPLVMFTFPTVCNFDPDEPALDILADILGGNKSSIFYQNFEKKQMAVNSGVSHPTAELAGRFQIYALPFPGHSLKEMDSLIRASLTEFEKRGVTDEDLQKYKITFEKTMINQLQSVAGKAGLLNQYLTRNPNYLPTLMAAYKKVTKEDVMRVYNKYIKNKPAVVLSVYPKGKPEQRVKEDTYKLPVRDVTNIKESDEYRNLVYNKAKDNFDRSKHPPAGPNPVVKVPDYWTLDLPNGLKMIGSKDDEVPMVTLQLNVECGHRFEEKSKSGLAQIMADLMNESTMKHSAEQISEELEKLGSSVDVSAGTNEIVITISCLKKNMNATFKLVEEILFQPKFDKEEFERSKNQLLEAIANQATQPVTIANNVYSRLLYGDDHIMSVPTIGTKETVTAITLDDVKNYYNANFSPNISQVIVVGDVTKEEILAQTPFLKTWADKKVVHKVTSGTPKTDKTKIFLVDKTQAPQSEVRIGFMSLPFDATGEYYKVGIMNYVLGGGFSSRINMNLREDKGWTYGSYCTFSGGKYDGRYTASGGIKGSATDSAIVEYVREIRNYAENGIKPEELEFTKSSIGQSDALKYETPGQKAFFLKRIIDYKLDRTFVDQQNKILAGMTKQEVDALAKKYLDTDKMVIMVVGDKEKIMEPLKKLGYEIVELDMDGNVVKKEEVKDDRKPNYDMNNTDKKDEPKKEEPRKEEKKKKKKE
jgi:zinc protease